MHQDERAPDAGPSTGTGVRPPAGDDDLRSRRRDAVAQRVSRARAIAALAASLADGIRDGDPGAIDGAQRALVPPPVAGVPPPDPGGEA